MESMSLSLAMICWCTAVEILGSWRLRRQGIVFLATLPVPLEQLVTRFLCLIQSLCCSGQSRGIWTEEWGLSAETQEHSSERRVQERNGWHITEEVKMEQKSAEDEDSKAWEVMMKGIHGQIPRKWPKQWKFFSFASAPMAAKTPAEGHEGDDAKGLQEMMMVMSRRFRFGRKLCLSKVHCWSLDPDGGIGPGCHPRASSQFFCLLVFMPKGKLSSHDEKKATHVFIDSFDNAEKQKLDWALTHGAGKHRCDGWEMYPLVVKHGNGQFTKC